MYLIRSILLYAAIGLLMPARTADIGDSVDQALRWLQIHQSDNGQWDVDGLQTNCDKAGPKVEPGTYRTTIDGDIALTSLSLLCFLEAGHVPGEGSYGSTTKKALAWLVEQQGAKSAGLFGARNYEHPMATWALVRAYQMSGNRRLKKPVEAALAVILARQAKDGRKHLAWDYVHAKPARNDSSATAWNLIALRAALDDFKQVRVPLHGTEAWFQPAWQSANPNWEELDSKASSLFPYTYNATTNSSRSARLTPLGLHCGLLIKVDSDSVPIQSLANGTIEEYEERFLQHGWPIDSYHLFHGVRGLRLLGREDWPELSARLAEHIIAAQHQEDDCLQGSWNPAGAGGHRVAEVGRSLVTALTTLSLIQLDPALATRAGNEGEDTETKKQPGKARRLFGK